jgi:hypothetical protein
VRIGLADLLFLLFLALKLTDHIAWSWWWVTAPLWGAPTLILGCLALVFVGVIIADLAERAWRRLRS